jgi:hypothetical protein
MIEAEEKKGTVMDRIWPLAPAMVVAFGALVVTLGGFWAAWRQSSFNSELREKNAEIARLQQENANAITGGASFCWMAFQVFAADGSAVNAFSMPDDLMLVPNFIHGGMYPLYDVSARIVDIEMIRSDIYKASTVVQVGNMTPGFASSSGARIFHHGKDFYFNIFYVARNGSWLQKLRMRWVGDGWAMAVIVLQGLGGGKELYREVSANYPRDEKGEVEWDEKPKPQQPPPQPEKK